MWAIKSIYVEIPKANLSSSARMRVKRYNRKQAAAISNAALLLSKA